MIPLIPKTGRLRYLFTKVFNIGRNKEIEEIIMTEYPEHIYNYADSIIEGRWPEAEHIIMKYPKYAYLYALEIIEGRWPEAEPYIMEDPYYAYLYANYVIGERWEEAEYEIMKDSNSAVLYALDILNDKWEEAEQYITMCDEMSNEKYYVEHFYGEGETLSNIRLKRDLNKMLCF